MTLSAVALGLLVRRAWGREATSGAGRTLGAVVVSAAVAGGVGDVLAFYWDASGLAGAVVAGVVVAGAVTVLYVAVMVVADRRAMQAAVARGRLRRGRR
jgi:putative peptidoglycan lipid II flippase